MAEYVLECNQSQAKIVHSNGDFETVFHQPLNIDDGDEISLRMASIQTQQVTNETFVFTEEQPVRYKHCYYVSRYPILEPTPIVQNNGLGDGRKYQVYYKKQRHAVIANGIRYDISELPKTEEYTYVPNQNNIRVEVDVVYLDHDHHIQYDTMYIDTRETNPYDVQADGYAALFKPINHSQLDILMNETPWFPNLTKIGTLHNLRIRVYHGINADQLLPYQTIDADGVTFSTENWQTDDGTASGAPLLTGTTTHHEGLVEEAFGFWIPAGSYSPGQLAHTMTVAMNKTLLNYTNTGTGTANAVPETTNPAMLNLLSFDHYKANASKDGDIYFKNDEVADTNFTYGLYQTIYDQKGAVEALWIGANNIAIEWDQSGVFSLTSNHTPCVDSNGTPSVVVINDPGANGIATTSTGIVFTGMEPSSFVQQLGIGNFIAPLTQFTPNAGTPFSAVDNIERYCAGPPDSQGYVLPKLDRTGIKKQTGTIDPKKQVLYFSTAGETNRGVLGTTPNFTGNKGSYLAIEMLNSGFRSTYIGSEKTLGHIGAVTSLQYIQQGQVTSFGDTAIPYVHHGPPFMLTQLRIRILDGTTKEVDSQLGEDNTVLVNVIKKEASA